MTNNWRLDLRSRSETREHFTRSMRLLATIRPDCSWYSAVKTDLLTSDQSDHKADTDGYRSLCFAGTSTIPFTYLRSNWYTTGQRFQIQVICIRVKTLALLSSVHIRS